MIQFDLMDTTDALLLLRNCALLLEFDYCRLCSCYSIRVMFSEVARLSLAYLLY